MGGGQPQGGQAKYRGPGPHLPPPHATGLQMPHIISGVNVISEFLFSTMILIFLKDVHYACKINASAITPYTYTEGCRLAGNLELNVGYSQRFRAYAENN